ncbi:FAD dependent oxidoreductase [Saccharata proteae CBS 121410]|uniref:FAD dependent oxidoreductase n=1 Tax=Saccharata proteae CBS 121410 TaxID=1314787 RepID=A0A9P4HRJ5_9PEZI|nr:FAD dependent oxidoreductase [Saccharata proteae CBS 121410]
MTDEPRVVIVGAGIIGCSTAYYLSESERVKPENIHIVESSAELFASASGLAGFAPSVAPLGALSFRLHKELAQKHRGNERWGYSRSTGTSLTQDPDNEDAIAGSGEDWLQNGASRADSAGAHDFKEGSGPAWLTRTSGSTLEVISRDASTAQIDPKRLCKFLLETCLERGVQLHQPAKAVAVSKDGRGRIDGVRIASNGHEKNLTCTHLLITSGAWTPRVFSSLFPSASIRIPISALAGHSLLLRSPRWSAGHEEEGCHAVFATDTLGFSPELFSRMGGEIYVAGLNSANIALPELATDVKITNSAAKQLKDVATLMLGQPGQQDDLQVLREGLCFRPVTSSGRPIISKVPDAKLGRDFSSADKGEGGVFVAAGHGAWGISQSLGTGKVMSEMLQGLPTSANIKTLALS